MERGWGKTEERENTLVGEGTCGPRQRRGGEPFSPLLLVPYGRFTCDAGEERDYKKAGRGRTGGGARGGGGEAST